MDDLGDLFSDGELALAVSGVTDNFRLDGRACFDIREIKVRAGVLSGCNGSASIQSKNCNITVGVKVEVGIPTPDEPDQGIVEISVDCSANASPKFEGRGGEDLAQELVFILSNAITPAIDRRSLCISEGHKVWIIYIDVLILECCCASQLLDLSAQGIKVALANTRVPKLIADEEDANDFVLSPDQEEYCPIDTSQLPILLTLTRIHDQYVADVTEEEAAAGIARLTLAFDSKGQLSYTKKSGLGSLHPDPLKEVLAKAAKLAIKTHQDLDKSTTSTSDGLSPRKQ